MRDKNRETLNLIYDDDLLPVFERLGLKDDFLNSKLKCSICGDVITIDNFYFLYYEGGIKFGCNKKTCITIIEDKKL